MKVLLFSTQWPEYMVELANGLSSYAEVTLVMPNNHRFTPKHAKLLNKQVGLFQYKLIFHKSIRDNFNMLYSILKLLWGVKPDILHIQANGHRLFYWVAIFKPWNTKIVNTIHDPAKHMGDRASAKIKDNLVIRLSKYFTNKYIVHGQILIEELVKYYNVPKRKVISIPHGHFEIYKKFKDNGFKTRHKNYVLFFGRIWKYKGLQYFIDAANKVIDTFPATMFYIVGKGEDLSNYNFDQNKKDNFFIDNRRVSLGEAAVYYENAAFVVLPYLEATQSGVIPVAYAFSKPVIATKVGAITDILIHNKTGFLVDKENTVQLAFAMEKLLSNNQLLTDFSFNAYQFAENTLSWENISRLTYETYLQLS
jgi:glycosyltransferase involved in cell wall biosynthesis